MSCSMYRSAVPSFIAILTNIKAWLDKASASHDEQALIASRLAPDMIPLAGQIQIASDAAKGAAARLTGVEAPVMPDTETSFAELKRRCDQTIAFLNAVDPAAFDAGASREVVITFPSGGGVRFDGETYLIHFAVPNFYFHATAAYAILRAQGVDLGKQDYLAHLAPHMFPPPAASA